MLNKNVADYTNFDGKTNKKIVQAPGGATHFSLAWSDQKTDYGPERVIKKKDNYQNYNEPPQYQNTPNYQKQQAFNYNEPIRLMQERPHEQYSNPQKQQMYSMHSVQSMNQGQGGKKYGGEHGYNNYTPQENYRAKQQYYQQQDSLDQKLQEEKARNSIPNNIPRPPQSSNLRPSIKIHEQKNNLVLGDNNYNYWRDNSEDRKNTNQSNRRPPLYEQPITQYEQRPQQPYPEKTSVKVHNPPGGKSSISFG